MLTPTQLLQELPSASELAEVIDMPVEDWAHSCHVVSYALMTRGPFTGDMRVVRGTAAGVMSQHSWLLFSDNAYDRKAAILDATLWSYVPSAPTLFVSSYAQQLHRPHGGRELGPFRPSGMGLIDGAAIELDVRDEYAREWLRQLGAPLAMHDWHALLHSGMLGWPSKPIIEAAYRDPRLRALVPIDIVGNATDLNPGGLYLPGEEVAA